MFWGCCTCMFERRIRTSTRAKHGFSRRAGLFSTKRTGYGPAHPAAGATASSKAWIKRPVGSWAEYLPAHWSWMRGLPARRGEAGRHDGARGTGDGDDWGSATDVAGGSDRDSRVRVSRGDRHFFPSLSTFHRVGAEQFHQSRSIKPVTHRSVGSARRGPGWRSRPASTNSTAIMRGCMNSIFHQSLYSCSFSNERSKNGDAKDENRV
jgi:hypothetical protein